MLYVRGRWIDRIKLSLTPPTNPSLHMYNTQPKQDHDEGGIVAAEPVERNPEVYRSLLSYVSDARKEEIYRLHALDPQVAS